MNQQDVGKIIAAMLVLFALYGCRVRSPAAEPGCEVICPEFAPGIRALQVKLP